MEPIETTSGTWKDPGRKKNPKKSRNKRGNLTKTRRWPTNRDKRSASSHWLVGPANGRWLWQNKQKTRRLPHRAIEMLFFFLFSFLFHFGNSKIFFFPKRWRWRCLWFFLPFLLLLLLLLLFRLDFRRVAVKVGQVSSRRRFVTFTEFGCLFFVFFCFALSFFFFFFPPLHHRVVPKFGSNLYWVLPGFPSLSGFTELYWVFTGLDWV